jgi:polysaccharide biosynthesis protein PslH
MKKILVIAPYAYLPFSSGGQKYIAKFLEWLGTETELTVIGTKNNDWSLAKNYRGLPLLKKSFSRYYDTSLVKKISSLIEKEGHEILICEHPYMAWLAFRIRKRTGIRVIIQTHNIEYQRFRSIGKWWWPILKRYERKSFKKADGIFFIAPEDKAFAIDKWDIHPSKCYDVPYGVETETYPDDRVSSKEEICRRHAIPESEKILLFTGVLSYKPNIDAFKHLVAFTSISLRAVPFKYKLIICGNGLPEDVERNLKDWMLENFILTGFVKDIDIYYKAADCFLNPVRTGGGVKTKVVEAIAYGATVISYETGALGIDKHVCGEKLITVADEDWEGFAKKILEISAAEQKITPLAYYQKYSWRSITRNLVKETDLLN